MPSSNWKVYPFSESSLRTRSLARFALTLAIYSQAATDHILKALNAWALFARVLVVISMFRFKISMSVPQKQMITSSVLAQRRQASCSWTRQWVICRCFETFWQKSNMNKQYEHLGLQCQTFAVFTTSISNCRIIGSRRNDVVSWD